MKMRPVLFSVVLLFMLAGLAINAGAITRFGDNPFYQPPLSSVEQMKNMFMEHKSDVQKGMQKAGVGELYEPLMAQLPNAEVTEVEYQKGQELEWMFYRKKGQGPVMIDKGVVWESDTPFTGYQFFVDYNGQRYTFVVPLACGNLALMGIGPIPAPVVPVAVPAPAPQPEPAPAPAPVPVPVAAASPIAFIADAGYLYQADPADYLLFRGGIEYTLADNLSLLGLVGVAPKVGGIDGKTAFVADIMLNYNWSKMYAGIGLGAWLTGGDSDLDTEDNDLDIIFNIGYKFYEKPDSFKLSGFIELRSAVDEMSDFDLYGRVGGGLRFHF